MQVKDYPVVILAAGKGKRLGNQFGGLNKTLLPLFDEHTILDILLFKIISQGVSQVKIITGHNSGNLVAYIKSLKGNLNNKQLLVSISKLFLNCDIRILPAREDYLKGPLYTLLTLNQSPPKSSLDQYFPEEIYFTVLPSDTIFFGGILEQVFSVKIQEEGIEAKNRELERCHLFVIKINSNLLNSMVKNQNFTFTSVEISEDKTIKFEKNSNQKNKDGHDYSILLPIAFVSSAFLEYSESILKRGVNKLMGVVENFLKDGHKIGIHELNYNPEGIVPFLDIDDITTYNRVLQLGKNSII